MEVYRSTILTLLGKKGHSFLSLPYAVILRLLSRFFVFQAVCDVVTLAIIDHAAMHGLNNRVGHRCARLRAESLIRWFQLVILFHCN